MPDDVMNVFAGMLNVVAKTIKPIPDEVYTITFKSGLFLHVTDAQGNAVEDSELDELIARISGKKTAYIYIAYGYVEKLNRRCHKIGMTVNTGIRMSTLGLDLIHAIPCNYSGRTVAERQFHGHFIEQGRWIDGEYFDLTSDDIALLKTIKAAKDAYKVLPNRLLWNGRYASYKMDEVRALYQNMRSNGFDSLIEYLDYQSHRRLEELKSTQ